MAVGETANISDIRAVESGRVIFSWVSQTGGFFGPRRLRAGKLESNGTSLWGSGVNFFSSGSLQIANFPIFEPDGTGGAVFSWYTTA